MVEKVWINFSSSKVSVIWAYTENDVLSNYFQVYLYLKGKKEKNIWNTEDKWTSYSKFVNQVGSFHKFQCCIKKEDLQYIKRDINNDYTEER